MRPETQSWLAQADEDLLTARVNLEGRRYYACVFFAQQAAEKALKALFIEVQRDLPPKGHNLAELARILKTPEEVREAAIELAPEYLVSRYPDAAVGIPAEMYTPRSAKVHLEAGERVLEWVKEQIKSAQELDTPNGV